MLKILGRKEFDGLTPIVSFISDKFTKDFFGKEFFRSGLWLEYWENDIINFKFNCFCNTVTIYSGWFSSQQTEENLKTFFNLVVNPDDLFDFLDNEVTIKLIYTIPKDSNCITKVWKYNFNHYFHRLSYDDAFFNDYREYTINDTKTIRCLPYSWGAGLRLYSPDNMNLDDKLYWFNLFLIKLYVTRWYKRSDKKRECIS